MFKPKLFSLDLNNARIAISVEVKAAKAAEPPDWQEDKFVRSVADACAPKLALAVAPSLALALILFLVLVLVLVLILALVLFPVIVFVLVLVVRK